MSRNFSPIKLGSLLILGIYFFMCLLRPAEGHFIDGVNLLIHEGGHVIFSPLGEFMHFLGGSLTQTLMPLIFAVYFFIRKDIFAGSIIVLWVGESLSNTSVYIKDAIVMQLPLIGGGIHDWNHLLGQMGLLESSDTIGMVVYISGWVILIAGLIGGVIGCFLPAPERRGWDI